MKECTQDEFYNFVDNYPRPLTVDVCGISEPPKKTYNDFTLGVWPESVVASCCVFSDSPYFTRVFDDYKPSRNGSSLEAQWKITT